MDSKNRPSSSPSPVTDPSPPSPEVLGLAAKARRLLKERMITEAFNLLEDACHKHEMSPYFHRLRSSVLYRYALSLHDNPQARRDVFKEALSCACLAIKSSPSNIEFSVFYTRLLVVHLGATGIEKAANVCERALSITNPVLHFLGCLGIDENEETLHKKWVAHYQEELRFVMDVLKSSVPSVECKKILVTDRKMFCIQKYLKSVSPRGWKDHLQVDVKDFKEHFSSFTDIITEALFFAQNINTWKIWVCPRCEQKFGSSESELQHVLNEHVGNLSEELNSFLPTEISEGWVNELVDGCWEPIHVQFLYDDDWRGKLLKDTQVYFTNLVMHNYLATSHLDKVLRYAMEEVQRLPSASAPATLNHEVNDQSLLCIRMLNSYQLQRVLDFLHSLTQVCELGMFAKESSSSDDKFLDNPETDVGIGALLDPDPSYINLNLKLLPEQSDHGSAHPSCPGNDEIMHVLCWFSEKHYLTEHFATWTQHRKTNTCQADKTLQKLKEEFEDLRTMCTKKRKLLAYQKSLQDLISICEAESTAMAITLEKMLLDNEKADNADDFVMNVISDILEEANAFKASKDGGGNMIESDNNGDEGNMGNSLDNSCVEAAFQKQDKSSSDDLSIIDAKIMKNLSINCQLKSNLARTSAIDYLTVLAPLLKFYVKMSIEEVAKTRFDFARGTTNRNFG